MLFNNPRWMLLILVCVTLLMSLTGCGTPDVGAVASTTCVAPPVLQSPPPETPEQLQARFENWMASFKAALLSPDTQLPPTPGPRK